MKKNPKKKKQEEEDGYKKFIFYQMIKAIYDPWDIYIPSLPWNLIQER